MSNEPDNVNSGALGTTMLLVAFATLAIALLVTSLVRDEMQRMGDERSWPQENQVRHLTAEQQGQLTAVPAWVDKAKGLVSVPIERAMKWTLEAVRANPAALTPGSSGFGGAGGAGPAEAQGATQEDAEAAEEQESEAVGDESAPGETSEQEQTEPSASPNPTGKAPASKRTPAPAPTQAPAVQPAPAPPAPAPTAPKKAPAPAPDTQSPPQ